MKKVGGAARRRLFLHSLPHSALICGNPTQVSLASLETRASADRRRLRLHRSAVDVRQQPQAGHFRASSLRIRVDGCRYGPYDLLLLSMLDLRFGSLSGDGGSIVRAAYPILLLIYFGDLFGRFYSFFFLSLCSVRRYTLFEAVLLNFQAFCMTSWDCLDSRVGKCGDPLVGW